MPRLPIPLPRPLPFPRPIPQPTPTTKPRPVPIWIEVGSDRSQWCPMPGEDEIKRSFPKNSPSRNKVRRRRTCGLADVIRTPYEERSHVHTFYLQGSTFREGREVTETDQYQDWKSENDASSGSTAKVQIVAIEESQLIQRDFSLLGAQETWQVIRDRLLQTVGSPRCWYRIYTVRTRYKISCSDGSRPVTSRY